MFILTGSRASGKTYNLFRECNNNNGVILVKDKISAELTRKYAEDLGFKNVRVMSYLGYINNVCKISPVYIDSIEDLFHFLFVGKVAGVATNSSEVISLNPYSNRGGLK